MCMYLYIYIIHIYTYMIDSVYLGSDFANSARYRLRTFFFSEKNITSALDICSPDSCHYSLVTLCNLVFGTHVCIFLVVSIYFPSGHTDLDVTVGQTECLSLDMGF